MTQLDQLLQKYEFENTQVTKALSSERERLLYVNKQKRDVDKQIIEFEEKIAKLKEEIRKEKVYEIDKNSEIERLKDESRILRDHRNSSRTRLDRQHEKYENMVLEVTRMVTDGGDKLDTFLKKYESIPGAREVLKDLEKSSDLKNKIAETNELVSVLREKEILSKSSFDKSHFQILKMRELIRNTLVESADLRKKAILNFSRSVENLKKIENEKICVSEVKKQNDSVLISLTEEMDTSTATSTPKQATKITPSIQLSPLTPLATHPPTIHAPRPAAFSIPQIKTPIFCPPTLTVTTSTPLIQKLPPKRNKVPVHNPDSRMGASGTVPLINHDTIISTPQPVVTLPSNHNNPMECAEPNVFSLAGQTEESEFRFGFLENSPKTSNIFGGEFECATSRSDSGFMSDIFSTTATSQGADNPFSFVP